MIQQIAQQTGGGIRAVCVALEEPRSTFYHAAVPTATLRADAQIGDLIEAIFRRHRRRYGYRRIAQELSDRGVACAAVRIRRIIAQRGLCAIQPKNFIPKTSDGRADKPSPNLLSDRWRAMTWVKLLRRHIHTRRVANRIVEPSPIPIASWK